MIHNLLLRRGGLKTQLTGQLRKHISLSPLPLRRTLAQPLPFDEVAMATVDRAFTRVRTLFGRLRFFRNGWGFSASRHGDWLSSIRAGTNPPATAPHIAWTQLPFNLSLGTFRSPCAHFLPEESATARVLYVPSSAPQGESPPIVLHLPATGDHGFFRRLACYAMWLRLRGVASLILEGPFYGQRRPAGQRGALLGYVHQLPDLGRATIEESTALLKHLRNHGFERQVVAGVSQGGLHAAMIASLCEDNPPVVMALAPHSAAPVFTKGVLADAVDWDALDDGWRGEGRARDRLEDVLQVTDIRNFPVREGAGRHLLLFAENDRYVTRDCVDVWQAARPHVEVHWVGGGHVTASVLHTQALCNTILSVLEPV